MAGSGLHCPPCRLPGEEPPLPTREPSPAWVRGGCIHCRGTPFSTSKADAAWALLRSAPQWPGVVLLIFHIALMIAYRACKLIGTRLKLLAPEPSEGPPAFLTVGYVYPILPLIAWAAAGAVGGLRLATAAAASFGIEGGPAAAPPPVTAASLVVAACGAAFGVHLLRGWRLWVYDATAEGYRVREKAILDKVGRSVSQSFGLVREQVIVDKVSQSASQSRRRSSTWCTTPPSVTLTLALTLVRCLSPTPYSLCPASM